MILDAKADMRPEKAPAGDLEALGLDVGGSWTVAEPEVVSGLLNTSTTGGGVYSDIMQNVNCANAN